MAEDYYNDQSSDTSDTKDMAEGEGGDKESSNTTLLPKSFFEGADKKPGDRCEIEVVRTYEDEVEVKYVPHKEGEEKSEEEGGGHMAALEDRMGTEPEMGGE